MESAGRSVEASSKQSRLQSYIQPSINGARRPLSDSPPAFTSAVSAWDGFLFEEGEVPVGHLPRMSYSKPTLFLFTAGKAHSWMMHGGTRYDYRVKPGQLYIMRGGHETQGAYQSGSWRMIQVELDTDKLKSLSETYTRAVNHSLVPFLLTEDAQVANMIQAMRIELEAGCPSGRLFAESISLALLYCVARRYSYARKLGNENIGKFDWRTQFRIEEYIHANLAADLSITEIAALVNMRPALFSRMFSATFGVTPYKYLLRMRLERAKTELIASEQRVVDIGRQWGFANQSHFTSVFHRATGMTPTQFRREHW